MDHQSQSDKPGLWYGRQPQIDSDRQIGMQGMKSDSTTVRIINRIGKQMIKIDNIGQ